MTTALTLTHYSKRCTKRRALQFLGLPFATHWHEAAPILKNRIAMARRNNDMDRAAVLSMVKAFLKKNLNRICSEDSCGAIISGGRRNCMMHRQYGKMEKL